jgi:hypothetical protein
VKRIISLVLVLFAVAAATFFFLKMRRYLPERLRGAELAPAETMFFAQLPNLRQTAVRIPQSDLYQIYLEPDVQAFLEKPRRKAPWMRAWATRFDEILRVAPGEFFVAFTSVDGPRSQFVGGFSFAGSQRNAQAFATNLKQQLFPEIEVVSSFRSNWYLWASDGVLLAELMARFDGKRPPGLSATPTFEQSITPLGIGQDLVLYGKPELLPGGFDFLTKLDGSARPAGPEAFAAATKIDGARLRDTIFLREKSTAPTAPTPRDTLPLAAAQTMFYYSGEMAAPAHGTEIPSLALLAPGLAGMEPLLAEKGVKWTDFPTVFGPGFGAIAEWPEDAALPTLLLASPIRDATKAPNFMEALTNPATSAGRWTPSEKAGVTLYTAPSQGFSFLRPTVALTDRFALLGMTPEAIAAALPQSNTRRPSLSESKPFQEAVHFVPDQAAAFGYLDVKQLFERLYRMARPFITLSLAFSAEAGTQLDAGKLPPVESISKHLSAAVFSVSKTATGTLIESAGSLTVPELLAGAGAIGAATGLPDSTAVSGVKGILQQKGMLRSKPGPNSGTGAINSAKPQAAPEKTEPNHK